jgi:transposase InsO family protein
MNTIRHGEDGTLSRNAIQHWLFLIREYQLIKAKKHPRYRFVQDFYKVHGLQRQNFIKYYHRFQVGQDPKSLLPQKRGPRYKARRTPQFIENKVLDLRYRGANRYEIHSTLKETLKDFTPSPSTIYGLLRKNNMNKLTPPMKTTKRLIIKQQAGELGHVDCHYLPKGLIADDSKRHYLVALIDSCTRIAWAEVVEDIQSLTVMFSVLRLFNLIHQRYRFQFQEVLTDNGPEFGSGAQAKNKQANPFERMLTELGVKHRYTRPYRPQTNGKVERFWKTLKEDLLEETVFDSLEDFRQELEQYILYYNEIRHHQALDLKTPAETLHFCHRIT